MSPLTSPAWWSAAATRALRTAAQTATGMIGTAAVGILAVDWVGIASVSATAAVASLLTALAGLPEVTAPQADEL